jgi:hypothetical protein
LAEEVLLSKTLPFDPYERYGGVGGKPDLADGYIVVMQHPVTTEYQDSRKHVEATLEAIHKLNTHTVVLAQRGRWSGRNFNRIRAFREQHQLPNVHFLRIWRERFFAVAATQ